MATPIVAPPTPQTSVLYTTRRALATVSFSLGFWGTLIFWWYPIGTSFCAAGLLFGLISLALGVRVSGQRGDHVGFAGVVMCSIGLGTGVAVYRFMQLFFEESIPTFLP